MYDFIWQEDILVGQSWPNQSLGESPLVGKYTLKVLPSLLEDL